MHNQHVGQEIFKLSDEAFRAATSFGEHLVDDALGRHRLYSANPQTVYKARPILNEQPYAYLLVGS